MTSSVDITRTLQALRDGSLTVDEARARIETEADLDFARVDTDRLRRRGFPEVVFGPGKTVEQIVAICRSLAAAGQDVFATRVNDAQAAALLAAIPGAVHHAAARAVTADIAQPRPEPVGQVCVVCAGTSDIPVAEEAALTAERLGARVERVFDVGVAGLHRLVRRLDTLRAARAVVVAAGMEGALPSVVGGLIDRPIIALPTSIGYGASFGGIAALLAMLNSCAPGITVVNIDNGFGAGVAAALINRQAS